MRRFYRYPATDEVIDVFSGLLPVINFELDPETGHEVELGGDTVHGALTLGGRVFYQSMNDEIIYDVRSNSNRNSFVYVSGNVQERAL